MKNKTKIYIASSIVLIVILIILAVITLIVKVNNDKIKPPASIENGEVSFNPDTMDEFCRMYYDNIYECSSLLITGTFTGDCINNEYYEKLFNKLNVDKINKLSNLYHSTNVNLLAKYIRRKINE